MGDENVVLAWVDDEVGWGIFAAKDFAQGKRLNPPPIGAGTRPHPHCADAGESRICARKGFQLPASVDAVWAARLGCVGMRWVGLGREGMGKGEIGRDGSGRRTVFTAAGAFISTIVGVVREQSTIKPTQARSP